MARLGLVTGGAGFIGSHVVKALLREGWRVRVLDDLTSGFTKNLPQGESVDFIQGDIRDAETCRRACEGVDCVFHLAAIASVIGSIENAVFTNEVNVGGTLTLLVAAKDAGVRRFVFSSSASVYGDAEVVPTDETQPLCPQSPYASGKACGEFYGNNFAEIFGIEFVTLRYFNVFGPYQNLNSGYAAVIPLFVKAALNGTTPTIFGDGLQTRDFVFVEDVALANVRAASASDVSGRAYNVAGGNSITLLDLLSALEKASENSLTPHFAPARSGEVRHSRADVGKAKEALCFSPSTSLEEGLRKTYEISKQEAGQDELNQSVKAG